MNSRFVYRLRQSSLRLALALWLLIGATYAGLSLLAEWYYQQGARSIANPVLSLPYMEKVERLAPHIQNLRVGSARAVIMNGSSIDLSIGSEVLAREINRDPWSLDLLLAYMAMRARAGDQQGALDTFARIRSFAPPSFPIKFMLRSQPTVSEVTSPLR